ncbi:hypothetical protein M9H77_12739 [Catharanthus roseus]|uniref:Uncharacterized protein n=1 Tax=Catharanthus roseus TaxID=4058 RepID=A0ACC0BIC0_CATRO|nr:hypothetical protein M9H77_12739 [Catharanthus roseus]
MVNPFSCDLAFDIDHMLKCSSPRAYLDKQLLVSIARIKPSYHDLELSVEAIKSSIEVLQSKEVILGRIWIQFYNQRSHPIADGRVAPTVAGRVLSGLLLEVDNLPPMMQNCSRIAKVESTIAVDSHLIVHGRPLVKNGHLKIEWVDLATFSAKLGQGHSFPKVLVAKLGKISSSHYMVYVALLSIGSFVECLNYKIFNRSSSTR